MFTATNELTRELDKVKKDFKQLQQRLSSILESAGSYSKEKLSTGRNRLYEAIGSLKDTVKEKACDAYEAAKRGGQQAIDKSRSFVAKKPLTVVCVAFLAGASIATVARRHKR